jgi:hypothetical protein
VLLLVFGTIALLFGVLLDPGEDLEGGSTGLYPGTYADAIVPAHLLAFAILTALVTWLSAQRSPTGRPGSGTLAASRPISAEVPDARECAQSLQDSQNGLRRNEARRKRVGTRLRTGRRKRHALARGRSAGSSVARPALDSSMEVRAGPAMIKAARRAGVRTARRGTPALLGECGHSPPATSHARSSSAASVLARLIETLAIRARARALLSVRAASARRDAAPARLGRSSVKAG